MTPPVDTAPRGVWCDQNPLSCSVQNLIWSLSGVNLKLQLNLRTHFDIKWELCILSPVWTGGLQQPTTVAVYLQACECCAKIDLERRVNLSFEAHDHSTVETSRPAALSLFNLQLSLFLMFSWCHLYSNKLCHCFFFLNKLVFCVSFMTAAPRGLASNPHFYGNDSTNNTWGAT